ncbi:MAG: tyrosine-type recombinase/integrase [Clostridiales bacterium]|jgi:integrase/recombinase XerD|nr:tyrosine-type recombinase/integrase [Clostridiales bacterium]
MQFHGRMAQFIEVRNQKITVKEGYDQFQNFNEAKNLSDNTIHHYGMSFRLFAEFYDVSKPCCSIVEQTIFEFISWMKNTRNINDITLNSYLRPIRAMLYYFMKQGFTAPFHISEPKATAKVKEPYTEYEMTILLKKPDLKKCTFPEYRTWVIINYLFATGNRVGTVSNIKIADVKFESRIIHLKKTKNRKEQIIPLSSNLDKILREYLRYRKGGADDYLFCNTAGERLTESALRVSIRHYNLKRGVMKTSVHLFRHTFAKDWIVTGGDPFSLQEALGHSTLDMTRKYVKMFNEDLKHVYEKHNPLDRFYEKSGNSRAKSKFKKGEFQKSSNF